MKLLELQIVFLLNAESFLCLWSVVVVVEVSSGLLLAVRDRKTECI